MKTSGGLSIAPEGILGLPSVSVWPSLPPDLGGGDPACQPALTRDLQTSQWPRGQGAAHSETGETGGPAMGQLWNHWFWVTLLLGDH